MNYSRSICALILILAPVSLIACRQTPNILGRTGAEQQSKPTGSPPDEEEGDSRRSFAATATVSADLATTSPPECAPQTRLRSSDIATLDIEASTKVVQKSGFAKQNSTSLVHAVLPIKVANAQQISTTPEAERPQIDGAAPRTLADDNTRSKSLLTLNELEVIAEESNPSLIQMAAVVEKARGIHEQVGLYPNPVVGYSGSEIGNDGAAGQQGGFISQTIVTGNKLALNRNVASWNIQELSWEYQVRKHRVLNDVRLRYYEVLGAQQRLSIVKELLKVAENGVRLVKQLEKAKQAPRADVLQATIDLNEIQIIQQNAQFEYDAAWNRLLTVLGRPSMQRAELAGSISGRSAQWTWSELYEKLLNESPQLQSFYARIEGSRAAIERQEAQPIPNLLTQFGMSHDFGTGDVISSVQIGVPLPIYNRNQGNIRLARSEYQRAVRDAERLQLELRDRLTVAFRDFQQAAFQVATYEKSILKNADESRKLTEESYQGGLVNFLRVLTARRTYFETNLRYLNSLIALRKSEVVIRGFVLTGGLTDVPDIASRTQNGLGIRGQALSGQ